MKPNEIIAALRQCEVNNPGACRKCPAYNQSAGCLDLLHQEAAELIEGLLAERRWIPVTESLLESGVRAIVCRGDKVEQGVFLGVNGWWKVYGTNTKQVTHWKPLPEPPETGATT